MADDSVAVLKECPLFSELPDSLLSPLASAAELRQFEPQATIFREGRPGNEVFVVRDGRVALEICAPGAGCRRILSIGPGELLGWSPILNLDQPLTATARSLEPVELLALDARVLRDLFEQYPELGYRFMRQVARSLAKRLTATRMQLLDLYGDEMAAIPSDSPSERSSP